MEQKKAYVLTWRDIEGLIPHFVTEKFNADRVNVFPCSSIKESIKRMET